MHHASCMLFVPHIAPKCSQSMKFESIFLSIECFINIPAKIMMAMNVRHSNDIANTLVSIADRCLNAMSNRVTLVVILLRF